MTEKLLPTEITLHQRSHNLEVAFNDGEHFSLPAEYLRVYSPSAEVQGHGPGQEVLQIGKHNVNIDKIEQVDRKSTRLNSSHIPLSRMPSFA